jgi:hypothetical protein
MALFGIGNILLKIKRDKLPRPEKATWLAVFVAITAVAFALLGNLLMLPKEGMPSNLGVFLPYFLISMAFIYMMLNRILILKSILGVIKYFNNQIISTINSIVKQEFVFFTKGDHLANLNRVMLYIKRNEHTKKIKIVTVLNKEEAVSTKLQGDIEFLDREYPEIDIDFVVIHDTFGPELIKRLSSEWKIPINFMFIGSPGDKFPYRIEQLGGVRLIM